MSQIPPTGAPGDYGEPTIVTPEEFEARIVPVVLENLDKFHRQEYRPDLARRLSKEEYARFCREHDMVSVTRLENGRIEANPFEHVRGGYRGQNSQMVVLEPEEVLAKLGSAVQEAFQLSS